MIIQAKGIEKSFGNLRVLKGVDFQVDKSEVVSIMGASGAGKSTLLQILGTLSTPDSGSLKIDGTDVLHLSGKDLSAFRNRRIGFVFQFHHLLPEFNALENVMIPAFIAGRSDKDANAAATALLSASQFPAGARFSIRLTPFCKETQGALPLDPTKGSSTLWTPFRAIQLVTLSGCARVLIGGTQGALPLDPAREFLP